MFTYIVKLVLNNRKYDDCQNGVCTAHRMCHSVPIKVQTLKMSTSQSDNLSGVVLDLNDISNIGHPCWELLDPCPDIYVMFDELGKLFFDGKLELNVDMQWLGMYMKESLAGESFPPRRDRGNGRMIINLNEKLLCRRSRRETIEILIVSDSDNMIFRSDCYVRI